MLRFDMKILLINYMETTSPGGINKVVLEIAKNLSNKHEVIVLQPNPLKLAREEVYNSFKIIGVKSRISKYLYGLNPAIYFYLKKNIKKINPDIVHIHGHHTLFSFQLVRIINKLISMVPIVYSPHYMPHGHDSMAGKYLWKIHNKIFKAFVLKKIDCIITASKFERDNFLKDISQDLEKKIYIIPHGIDDIKVNSKIKSINENKINLIYAGYLQKRKGVHYALRVLHELIRKNAMDSITFNIIGKGKYENTLRNLARELKIDEYIKWKGFLPREEFAEEISNADIFLLLSKNENYGITVPETLSLGTPIIVSNNSALKEFLNEPGCFGVDYPPDPKRVAELILQITRKEVKIGPFSNRIKTWDKVVEHYNKIYNDLV
jgi:glycosyltransferase involved in cell wall biosynthesis